MSLTFPGFDKIWLLENPLATRPFRGEVLGNVTGESIAGLGYPSDLHLLPLSEAMGRPSEPLMIRWSKGSRVPSNIIWIDTSAMVVSPRVLAALSGFSGWSTYEVTVEHHESVEYRGFSVNGRCGPAKMDATKITDGVITEYEGIVFDPHSWDGSDVFWASHGAGLMVTDEVRKALNRNKIYNIEWVRSDKLRFPKSTYDKLVAMRANRQAPRRYLADPLRSFMIRLGFAGSVREAVSSGALLQCEIPAELDARLMGSGIRVVVFDEEEEVDAIVQQVAANGDVSALPIRFGHGSLRPRLE